MSRAHEIVSNSVRMGGRDTDAHKKTRFLDMEALQSDAPVETEAKYEIWTDEHTAQSRLRRENRANRPKPPLVAEVEEFDVDTHLANAQAEKERANKSKWKFW